MLCLQKIVNQVIDVSQSFALSLNINKNKYMIISKNQIVGKRLIIRGQKKGKVQKYRHLDTWVNEDWEHSMEIESKVKMARGTFQKNVLRSLNVMIFYLVLRLDY